MTEAFDRFKKHRDYLICIDSDGCAMDTMDIKHIRCFGPCMIAEWGLEPWRKEVQKLWNDINLYTMTRGINRFKGLVMALTQVDGRYKKIEGLESLIRWAETASELSNENLEQASGPERCGILSKALEWSREVNRQVAVLPEEEKKPFDGVREGLTAAHRQADVAVVSSANRQAILEEWEKYHLLEYTDIILSQDDGSKAYCIGELTKKGYAQDHVLMVGDAPGDQAAAQTNGVLYYPILVGRESQSWERLRSEGLTRLAEGRFGGDYQRRLNEEFEENLR